MKVQSFAECSPFDPHLAISGIENQFSVFLKVAVLHMLYCMYKVVLHIVTWLMSITHACTRHKTL